METPYSIAANLKVFLTQECIGYQKCNGTISGSVIESTVLLNDDTTRTVWRIMGIDSNMRTISVSEFLLDCPRIDIPANIMK